MRILLIQTAFLGDVVLATAVIEKIKKKYPESHIDYLIRKGNEPILENNPLINRLLLFDKKNKVLSLFNNIFQIRKSNYDLVININRHFSSGIMTLFSGAKEKAGFEKNPFSFFYSLKVKHDWNLNELERNQKLIENFTDKIASKPKLYPSEADYMAVYDLTQKTYVTISPFSVWNTKQLPFQKWADLINNLSSEISVYIMGAPTDFLKAEDLLKLFNNKNVINLCGKQRILEETAIYTFARMNYVLDSAPMHICSAVNAPQTVIYCSTSPKFGFIPFSDQSRIVMTEKKLGCHPCGKHGHKVCPKKHFDCGDISAKLLLSENK